jgi:hypothetical protein
MSKPTSYSIGTAGVAWGAVERAAWLARQVIRRSYEADVLRRIEGIAPDYEVIEYGRLAYEPREYSLYAIKTRAWVDGLPYALVTGGVHGYETSGVLGALEFLERRAADYVGRVNLMVVPCVSPWAYETVNRWNPYAVDPNRSFREASPAQEAEALMRLIRPNRDRAVLHIDLHETTDTDESEFRPALAARDGVAFVSGEIPDGFYLVDDSENPNPAFQKAVIEAVARVTHIAAADERGEIIGSRVVAPGVIQYPMRQLGLCGSLTNARCRTTTEVYPDSAHATAQQCNAAQVAAVCAGLDFALG